MRTNAKRVLYIAVIVMFIASILGYAAFQSRGILSGPQIRLERPADGLTSSTTLVVFSGNISNAAQLFLNDRPIFVDLAGRFREELLLSLGYNIIELKAEDAQGRSVTVTRTLIFR